jgi:hypothetical protein
MSLLDDVSIVVTPNGYKAGELYAVIPSDGAADMDVTRATAATRVDENGLVNYAEIIGGEEVIDGSFPYPNTVWGGDASTVFAEGSATLTGTGAYANLLTQTNVLESGKLYKVTYTCDLSSVTSGALKLQSFSDNAVSRTVLDGTNTVELTANGTTLYISEGGMSGTAIISNISAKEVTRDNVPRIDYTGGGCPHILAEPMRTNLIPYSEDLTEWNKGNLTIASNDIISPDGTQNADTLDVPDTNDFIYEGATTIASTEYVFSFYVKRGTIAESSLKLAVYDDTNNAFIVSDISYSASDSEWTRVTQSFTTPVGCILIRAYAFRNSSSTLGTFSVWGAQLEEGSYATSYIPNFGTALGVTRNQDIFTRDGIGSLINSTEGVLFLEIAALSDDGTNRILGMSNGGFNDSVLLRYDSGSNKITAQVRLGGAYECTLNYTVTDVLDYHKIAFKYKVNDFALWVDGFERDTEASGNVVSGLDELSLSVSSSNKFYGKIKQLQVYTTALTDTQLDALTS